MNKTKTTSEVNEVARVKAEQNAQVYRARNRLEMLQISKSRLEDEMKSTKKTLRGINNEIDEITQSLALPL